MSFGTDDCTKVWIKKDFERRNGNIFLSISWNICFGCSKESSHWNGFHEYMYQQYMFRLRNKENNCHPKACVTVMTFSCGYVRWTRTDGAFWQQHYYLIHVYLFLSLFYVLFLLNFLWGYTFVQVFIYMYSKKILMRWLCPKFSDFQASEVLFWVLVYEVVLGALSKAIILLMKRNLVACGCLNYESFSHGTVGWSWGFPGRTQYLFFHTSMLQTCETFWDILGVLYDV